MSTIKARAIQYLELECCFRDYTVKQSLKDYTKRTPKGQLDVLLGSNVQGHIEAELDLAIYKCNRDGYSSINLYINDTSIDNVIYVDFKNKCGKVA